MAALGGSEINTSHRDSRLPLSLCVCVYISDCENTSIVQDDTHRRETAPPSAFPSVHYTLLQLKAKVSAGRKHIYFIDPSGFFYSLNLRTDLKKEVTVECRCHMCLAMGTTGATPVCSWTCRTKSPPHLQIRATGVVLTHTRTHTTQIHNDTDFSNMAAFRHVIVWQQDSRRHLSHLTHHTLWYTHSQRNLNVRGETHTDNLSWSLGLI